MYKRKFKGSKNTPRKVILLLKKMDLFKSIQKDEYDNSLSWNDIKEGLVFLHPREKYLINLIRFGKSVSDIAVIFGYNSRQAAHKEIRRIFDTLKFYIRNMEIISKLYTGQYDLSRKEVLIVRMYVLQRLTREEIRKRFDLKTVEAVSYSIRKIKKKMFASNEQDLYNMIDECVNKYSLRNDRRLYMKDAWREDIYNFLLKNIGKVWYVWGGQNLDKKIADCSGLVIDLYKKFGILPNKFLDMTAQGLYDTFYIGGKTNQPKKGDLVFYGKSSCQVSHVMIYVGSVPGLPDKNYVAGMCGGQRNMNKKVAKLFGSGLWIRRKRYRKDFLGCVSVK